MKFLAAVLLCLLAVSCTSVPRGAGVKTADVAVVILGAGVQPLTDESRPSAHDAGFDHLARGSELVFLAWDVEPDREPLRGERSDAEFLQIEVRDIRSGTPIPLDGEHASVWFWRGGDDDRRAVELTGTVELTGLGEHLWKIVANIRGRLTSDTGDHIPFTLFHTWGAWSMSFDEFREQHGVGLTEASHR